MQKVARVTATLVVAWALVALVCALTGAPRWAVIHPLTLGAVTTAILTFSSHFTDALTRTATTSFAGLFTRIAAVNLALVALLVDALRSHFSPLSHTAATVAIAAVIWHGVTIMRRLRAARGGFSGPFAATARCYVAAAVFFALAVVVVLIGVLVPSLFDAHLSAHSRLAIWGFAFPTVAGTVVTLLPTIAGTGPALVARTRIPRALAAHCVALSLAAACLLATPHLPGSLSTAAVSLAGAALLVSGLAWAWALQPVLAAVIAPGLSNLNASALSVAAGLLWLLAALFADAVLLLTNAGHVASSRIPDSLLALILTAGLAQMIAGVLGHLLPVLTGHRPGPDTGFVKVGILNAGAIVALVSPRIGLAILAVGLLLHVARIVERLAPHETL